MRTMQAIPRPVLKSALALGAVAFFALAVSTALNGVHAQDQAQDDAAVAASYAEFQYATITGSNNVLNVTMLPVITPTGTVYKNLTLKVNADSNGDITVAPGSPTIVAAPAILASSFQAGTYVGPATINGGQNKITVTGPGVIPGGTTVWSLRSSSDPNVCTYPASATWYVGVPTSPGNPEYARLKKAGITSTAYSYGTSGTMPDSTCNVNDAWSASLIGVSQTGNSITIVSYTTLGFADQASPKDQITYTLQQ
jgi:hypothetical protein